MKKLLFAFALLFIEANFTSCTPTSLTERATEQATEECCGEDGELDPPPPPPPPPTGGKTSQGGK